MNFDENQFLTDIYEALVELPGDPVRQIDHAIHEVIGAHVKVLRKFAQEHRVEILEMAEERRQDRQAGPHEVEGLTVVRIQYSERDTTPIWLDGSVRAVRAERFADVDSGEGGITRGDIGDETLIAALDTFFVGAEVYIESRRPRATIFSTTTPEAERESHIWWRARVLAPEDEP